MNFSQFFDYVKGMEGKEIPTIGGRASFQVAITNEHVIYTPSSSGTPRTQDLNNTKSMFDLYLKKKSLTTSHYQQEMRNASYLLALIGGFFSTNQADLGASITDPDKAEEGLIKERTYLSKTRNQGLVQKRKEQDDYKCTACDFKLKVNEYHIIDCHHLFPIAMGERETTIDDLVSLCPTCHRIAHRRNPPFSLDEIREVLEK
jgi:hypothetical protein